MKVDQNTVAKKLLELAALQEQVAALESELRGELLALPEGQRDVTAGSRRIVWRNGRKTYRYAEAGMKLLDLDKVRESIHLETDLQSSAWNRLLGAFGVSKEQVPFDQGPGYVEISIVKA